jgi:hypothetical protein
MRGHGAQRHPFPANTRGFLYFKPQNELSPLAGGLRFRLTDTPHPDSFPHGRDLLWPFGDPWQLTFVQIAIHNSYQHFLNQILRDGFVSASESRRCREIFSNQKRIHPRFMLFSMAQPFIVDLASKPSLCVVGAKEVRTTRLTTTFTDLRDGSEVYYPFEGMYFPSNDPLFSLSRRLRTCTLRTLYSPRTPWKAGRRPAHPRDFVPGGPHCARLCGPRVAARCGGVVDGDLWSGLSADTTSLGIRC